MIQTMIPIAETPLVYAFSHSDLLGQLICVVLLIFSVAVWVVMLHKGSALNRAIRESVQFQRLFREKKNPLALREHAVIDSSPAARVYQAACDKITSLHIENSAGGRRALSNDELEIIYAAMNQTIEEQIMLLEGGSTFLSTAVSGSPFLGLFGTVWGITIAFTHLAMEGRADIQTLAPGVSGALLTTVIALIVAIPSLVGYNIVGAQLKRITVLMDNFAEEVHSKFKIEQLEAISAARMNKQN